MPSIPCRAVEEEPSAEDEADAEGDNNEDEGSEEEENSPPTAERVARYEAHRREQKRLCAQARRKQMRTALFQESIEPDDASEACGRLPTTLQILKRTPMSHLVFQGKIAPSRAGALLIIAEVSERDGKVPQFGQQRHPVV